MSNFQKIVSGALRGNTVLGTDIGSGAATSTQFLAANGSAGSAFRSLVSGDIPSLSTIYLPLSGGTMSGAINGGAFQASNFADPTTNQALATKNYVDTVASGLQPLQSVYAGTTGSNLVGTYLNGVSGVGATFIITATGAFTVDGTTPPVNSRILIKDQSSGFQNGVYNLTVAGTTGVSPILTRASDYNTASDMNSGAIIPIMNGTINSSSGNPTFWVQTATITTVGTDALTFVKFNQGGSGTVTSVGMTVPTFMSVTPATITTTGTFAVTLSGTALPFANGGTGGTTYTGAKTTTYAVAVTDLVVPCDGTSGGFTVTLPAPAAGQIHTFIKSDNTFNQITIAPHGSEKINFISGNYILYTYKETVTLQSDGTDWFVISHKCDTPWVSYTMVVTGSSANPTKATSPTRDMASWRRVGDTMEFTYSYAQTATTGAANGTGTYLFAIPNSSVWTVDSTKMFVGSADGQGVVGSAGLLSGSLSFIGIAYIFDSTRISIKSVNPSDPSGTTFDVGAGSGSGFTNGATTRYTFNAKVPITGWNE